VRAGARIEIQALHLAIYSLGEDLTSMLEKENADFTLLKERIKEKTKHLFFTDGILCDGFENGNLDKTIRPNVFLAYYAYPNLFSKDEWKKIFNKTIEACWLDWGGFSTIDKSNYMFRNEHTGFNNESYHRGDSWFFINNIAATCMLHLDKHYFFDYIKTIRRASVTEMIHRGFLGQCAEVSSAKELCSRGALAQAWSAGTLIELLSEYHKDN
jgi:glycogen debranching enzyme